MQVGLKGYRKIIVFDLLIDISNAASLTDLLEADPTGHLRTPVWNLVTANRAAEMKLATKEAISSIQDQLQRLATLPNPVTAEPSPSAQVVASVLRAKEVMAEFIEALGFLQDVEERGMAIALLNVAREEAMKQIAAQEALEREFQRQLQANIDRAKARDGYDRDRRVRDFDFAERVSKTA